MKVISCGIIPVRMLNNEPEYLLLQDSGPGNWGFPKGQIDDGESHLEAALRETKEESGLSDLELVKDFEVAVTYDSKGDSKIAFYFLGLLKDPSVEPILSWEHSAYEWMGYTKAIKTLREHTKDVLVKAHEELTRTTNP